MKYATSDKKPTEMFIKALPGGGSSSVCCNCGRTHYAPNNLYNSRDEDDYNNMVNDCLEEQKKDPEGVVINYEDDFVYTKEIDGKVFVVDCPCNGLTKYEDWLWFNKDIIRNFLKLRIEQEYQWAQEQLTLNKLAGI